jgi:hypothetical protein
MEAVMAEDESLRQMQQTEILINEFQYDNQVMITVMQLFLVNMLTTRGTAALALAQGLKQQASEILFPPSMQNADPKAWQFVSMRIERFFQVIEESLKRGGFHS